MNSKQTILDRELFTQALRHMGEEDLRFLNRMVVERFLPQRHGENYVLNSAFISGRHGIVSAFAVPGQSVAVLTGVAMVSLGALGRSAWRWLPLRLMGFTTATLAVVGTAETEQLETLPNGFHVHTSPRSP